MRTIDSKINVYGKKCTEFLQGQVAANLHPILHITIYTTIKSIAFDCLLILVCRYQLNCKNVRFVTSSHITVDILIVTLQR